MLQKPSSVPLFCQNLTTVILFYQVLPNYILDKLQKVQNSAARLVFKARRLEHIKPLLQKLHWLPVVSRIQYKVATLCYNSFTESYPVYLSELLTVYHPNRQLRSISDTRTFLIPFTKTKTFLFHGPDTVELVTVWCSSLSINIFFQTSFKN